MGNYSYITQNNLTISQTNKIDFGLKRMIEFGDEIKFFGYWDEQYLNELARYGKEEILKGEIIIKYEDEPSFILCGWNKKGFYYIYGETRFPVENKKEIIYKR